MFSRMRSAVVDAARSGIRAVVNFAYQNAVQVERQRELALDALRRAAYTNNLDDLFEGKWPKGPDVREKLLMPDMTIRQMVDKFATNIFIKGTAFSGADETKTVLIQDIIKATTLNQKLTDITTEAALMGYVGLRSVWHTELNNWVIEIKPKEEIRTERDGERITAIIIQYQFWDTDKVLKWYREKWTDAEYTLWEPIKVTGMNRNQEPDWEKAKFSTEINTFGEIPITLVSHQYSQTDIGIGVVRKDDIDLAKALVRLKNKRHFAHLEHMDPTVAVLNGSDDDDVERGVGAVIRIRANSSELPPNVQLLEMAGVPDSVKDEIMEHVVNFYKNAGLTPPSEDDIFRTGTTSSAVALRVKDTDESKTMETLRDDGYSAVAQHLEKLLRMGARTRKHPDYAQVGINPDDPESYKVVVKYPPFFPPTPEEQMTTLQTLRQSHLSAAEKAKREAQIFLIEDQAEIDEIQANIEQEQELQQAALTTNRLLSSARQEGMPPKNTPAGG